MSDSISAFRHFPGNDNKIHLGWGISHGWAHIQEQTVASWSADTTNTKLQFSCCKHGGKCLMKYFCLITETQIGRQRQSSGILNQMTPHNVGSYYVMHYENGKKKKEWRMDR